MKKSYALTSSQRKVFNEFRRALYACKDAGIYLWDDYGTISAVNGRVVLSIHPDEALGEELEEFQVTRILDAPLDGNADDDLFVRRR